MPKPKPEDIDKKVKEEEQEFYGDETVSGTSPDPENINTKTTEELVEDVIGNQPEEGKPFNIGKEVNKDEEALVKGLKTSQQRKRKK